MKESDHNERDRNVPTDSKPIMPAPKPGVMQCIDDNILWKVANASAGCRWSFTVTIHGKEDVSVVEHLQESLYGKCNCMSRFEEFLEAISQFNARPLLF